MSNCDSDLFQSAHLVYSTCMAMATKGVGRPRTPSGAMSWGSYQTDAAIWHSRRHQTCQKVHYLILKVNKVLWSIEGKFHGGTALWNIWRSHKCGDFYDFWGALMDLFCVSLKIPADTVEWKGGLKVRSSEIMGGSCSVLCDLGAYPSIPCHTLSLPWCVPTIPCHTLVCAHRGQVCPPSKIKTDASIISPSPATCCSPGISPHET